MEALCRPTGTAVGRVGLSDLSVATWHLCGLVFVECFAEPLSLAVIKMRSKAEPVWTVVFERPPRQADSSNRGRKDTAVHESPVGYPTHGKWERRDLKGHDARKS